MSVLDDAKVYVDLPRKMQDDDALRFARAVVTLYDLLDVAKERAASPSAIKAGMDRDDAARELLDALAVPDGRSVRRAWDRANLLYGRFDSVLKRSAFEQYLDELAGVDP